MSIAERVIGMDISWNMLANAQRNERVRFVQARAESIPLQRGSAPILSTALALHWFDRDQFLREAWRVLSAEGLLLVYTNGFVGIMREDATFQHWAREVYPERFPTPPRDSNPLTPEKAAGSGFAFIGEDSYENEVSFTPEELVAYLTTQTNVAAAVEQGRESYESANQWLLEQVRPFFTDSSATFVFLTRAWYLRKEAVR
jgi:SAM-dependent methyltransferase